ncbi:tryptophan-rich sensory protein [Arthrobacter echini]|uniref:Tryptophan-rich sensory protein n=1 Tax=Arthrobacter echini TaxID=1529066 RepID=A0A4S5EA55_9MICC|nr:tryptophan-rich sensory protein [Arthrobacter echini]THJ68482.1 tryptophan-rich sensory protein [Arthrobacter echini]
MATRSSTSIAQTNGSPAHATTADRVRQIVVTVSEIISLLGPLIGFGLIGSDVNETSGGDLASDATLVAPGGPAFSIIWSAIYLGLFVYTIWQWLPSRTVDTRARATGWLVALSMLLNAAWLIVTQEGLIWLSVGVIIALLVVLVALVVRLTQVPAQQGGAEALIVDGTFGLYLGWVSVATAANIAAALASSGVATTGTGPEWAVAALVLFLAGALTLLQARVGGRWAVAVGAAWGLGWITVARISDEPASTIVAIAAAVAAVLILAATGIIRSRRNPTRSPEVGSSARAGR